MSEKNELILRTVIIRLLESFLLHCRMEVMECLYACTAGYQVRNPSDFLLRK